MLPVEWGAGVLDGPRIDRPADRGACEAERERLELVYPLRRSLEIIGLFASIHDDDRSAMPHGDRFLLRPRDQVAGIVGADLARDDRLRELHGEVLRHPGRILGSIDRNANACSRRGLGGQSRIDGVPGARPAARLPPPRRGSNFRFLQRQDRADIVRNDHLANIDRWCTVQGRRGARARRRAKEHPSHEEIFGGLLVAIGILLAGTTGLCTGAVILFSLPSLIKQPGPLLSASPLLLVGIIPCALGVFITRAGFRNAVSERGLTRKQGRCFRSAENPQGDTPGTLSLSDSRHSIHKHASGANVIRAVLPGTSACFSEPIGCRSSAALVTHAGVQ